MITVVAASATLPATTAVDAWLREHLAALHRTTIWVVTDATMGDRALRDALVEAGARVLVYRDRVREEWRGGAPHAEKPRRLRNVDQEIVLDLEAARVAGLASRAALFRGPAFAEDLEVLRQCCAWYRIEVTEEHYVVADE